MEDRAFAAGTGERYGETDLIEVAGDLSQRIATEDLIDDSRTRFRFAANGRSGLRSTAGPDDRGRASRSTLPALRSNRRTSWLNAAAKLGFQTTPGVSATSSSKPSPMARQSASPSTMPRRESSPKAATHRSSSATAAAGASSRSPEYGLRSHPIQHERENGARARAVHTLAGMPHRHYKRGTVVAHRGLDEASGTAKFGRVEEEVGDELVIASWHDEPALVGFDRREVQRLIMVPGISRGPLLLYPHHLWAIVKRPFALVWHRLRG
jgi:hypothetical protein